MKETHHYHVNQTTLPSEIEKRKKHHPIQTTINYNDVKRDLPINTSPTTKEKASLRIMSTNVDTLSIKDPDKTAQLLQYMNDNEVDIDIFSETNMNAKYPANLQHLKDMAKRQWKIPRLS